MNNFHTDPHSPLLIVKVGSGSITRASGPDTSILADTLAQSIEAMRAGWQVVLVSSGAQSVGRAVLAGSLESDVSPKLAASFGQPILMDFYRSQAALRKTQVSQFLVGEADLRSESHLTAIVNVIGQSLAMGIIPIVNGNDPADNGKTNNDLVAAAIAVMARASHLLLLTDVDAVYADGAPGVGRPLIELAVDEIHLIRSAGGSKTGTGGIRSKLRAAEVAARSGIETRIAGAREDGVIRAVVEGASPGTLIRAAQPRQRTRARRWVAGGAVAQGTLVVNFEAELSVQAGSSLFASGVKRVKGDFRSGDVVEVVSPQGKLLARGRARLSAVLLGLVRALRVDEIAEVLVRVLERGASSSDLDRPGRADNDAPLQARPVRLDDVERHLDELSRDTLRQLVSEVSALFPEDAAGALVGRRRFDDRPRLVLHYAALVGGLTVIENDHLVAFGPD